MVTIKKEFLRRFGIAMVIAALTSVAQAQQANHRAAFDTCMKELNLPLPKREERPQAPDEDTRAKIDNCLKSKGFEPPQRGPRGHHPPPPPETSGAR